MNVVFLLGDFVWNLQALAESLGTDGNLYDVASYRCFGEDIGAGISVAERSLEPVILCLSFHVGERDDVLSVHMEDHVVDFLA